MKRESLNQDNRVVVAFRGSSEKQGLLFARHLDAKLVLIDTIKEIKKYSRIRVVILPWQLLSSELLHELYETGRKIIPGILAASTPKRLEKVVKKQIQQLDIKYKSRLDVLPMTPIGFHTLQNKRIIGNKCSPNRLKKVISLPTKQLNIAAHSDGYDTSITPCILCPIAGSNKRVGALLTCESRMWCHRLSQPIQNISKSKVLVSLESINAKTLVYLVCFAIPIRRSHEKTPTPLLERIIVDGYVYGIAAMWGIGFFDQREAVNIFDIFEESKNIGEALKHVHSLKIFIEKRIRLAIFGDPDLQVTTNDKLINIEVNEGDHLKMSFESFLDSFIHGCVANSKKKQTNTVQELLTASKNYNPIKISSRLQSAIVKATSSFGTMPMKQWFNNSVSLSPSNEPYIKCPNCGEHSVKLEATGFKNKESRTVVSCPICGISQDYAKGESSFIISLESDKQLIIKGPLEQKKWNSNLFIERSKDEGMLRVPLTPYATNELHASLPKDLKAGEVTAFAIFVSDDEISFSRRCIWIKTSTEKFNSTDKNFINKYHHIEADRLILRKPEYRDSHDIFNYGCNERATKYLEWKTLKSVNEAEKFIAKCTKEWKSSPYKRSWVIEELSSHSVIGAIDAIQKNDSIYLGYVLNPTHHRYSYAFEAVNTLINVYASNGKKTFCAVCDPQNTPSIKLLKRCGFSKKSELSAHLILPNLSEEPRNALLFQKTIHERRR